MRVIDRIDRGGEGCVRSAVGGRAKASQATPTKSPG